MKPINVEIAEFRYFKNSEGNSIFWEFPLLKATPTVSFGMIFMGLGKPKLHAEFEVAIYGNKKYLLKI